MSRGYPRATQQSRWRAWAPSSRASRRPTSITSRACARRPRTFLRNFGGKSIRKNTCLKIRRPFNRPPMRRGRRIGIQLYLWYSQDMREIVQDGAPVLREVAKPVPEKLFGSTELTEFVADMAAVLDQEPDWVALAAPQVGVSWRLFIVRMDRVETPPLHDGAAEDEAVPARPAAVEVYVNPEIIKTSRK